MMSLDLVIRVVLGGPETWLASHLRVGVTVKAGVGSAWSVPPNGARRPDSPRDLWFRQSPGESVARACPIVFAVAPGSNDEEPRFVASLRATRRATTRPIHLHTAALRRPRVRAHRRHHAPANLALARSRGAKAPQDQEPATHRFEPAPTCGNMPARTSPNAPLTLLEYGSNLVEAPRGDGGAPDEPHLGRGAVSWGPSGRVPVAGGSLDSRSPL